jgi:phosphohistidine phosphatase
VTEHGLAGRQLVLIRHAKSSWDDVSLADRDRPLAARGRKAVVRMRDHLASLRIRPDLVLCSSARRTRETLEGVWGAFDPSTDVQIDDRLYGAGAASLLDRLTEIGDSAACVVLVGHNPGLADLLELLVARNDDPAVESVPTGAIATLSFEGSWPSLAPGNASLDDFWRPRHRS